MKNPSEEPIFWETITSEMRQVMTTFGQTQIGARFYIAGGTALALQIGHRHSVDLDFFSPTEDIPSIRQPLLKAFKGFQPTISDTAWGNMVLLVKDIRVGFYGYGYQMVASFKIVDQVRLASVLDIGLMKLDALLARASRKDFHDLYAICQNVPMRELLDLASIKYPSVRDFETQVVKRFVFFERAEQEAPVPLITQVAWETVKAFFRQKAAELGHSWLS